MTSLGFRVLSNFAFQILAFSASLAAQPPEIRIDDAATPFLPMELASGKVHFEAEVGDWGPQWFLLDTGANMSVLNWDAAERFGLELRGHGSADSAAGNASFDFAFTELPRLCATGLEVSPRGVAVIKRKTEAANGHVSIGLIGADFMKAAVVEIDYSGSRIRFHDPSRFEYQGKGLVLPLSLDQNGKPHIVGTLTLPDGLEIEADLLVDTGSRGLLTLARPFVETHRLEVRLAPPITATVGYGVGGPVLHRLARLGAVTVGTIDLPSPIVDIPPAGTKGAYGREDRSGVLGARFLRRFHVIFDYPHERLILEPTPDFDEPFENDGSGTFLMASGDFEGVEILDVAEGSPGQEAGLRAGDALLSIDDQPIEDLGLEGARALFMKFGQRLRLVVRRDSEIITLELAVRRLV